MCKPFSSEVAVRSLEFTPSYPVAVKNGMHIQCMGLGVGQKATVMSNSLVINGINPSCVHNSKTTTMILMYMHIHTYIHTYNHIYISIYISRYIHLYIYRLYYRYMHMFIDWLCLMFLLAALKRTHPFWIRTTSQKDNTFFKRAEQKRQWKSKCTETPGICTYMYKYIYIHTYI
jgi:hypothetical protein